MKSSFPIVALTLTIAAILVMLKLGFWQLDRMHEKEVRLDKVTQRSGLEPMSLTDMLATFDDPRDVTVSFVGTPNLEQVFYVDNRIVDGKVGYEVVVPVSTNVGIVMVNYGWLPAGRTRDVLPRFTSDNQLQRYVGVVNMPSLNPVIRETAKTDSGFPLRIQQIDIARMSELANSEFSPFVVVLPEGYNAQFIGNWQPVVMPPEKHLGYAVQWFGLAIAASFIFIFAVIRRKGRYEEKQ